MAPRRTHNYPHGKPLPLVLVTDLGMGALAVLWVVLVPGHWARAIGIVVGFLVLLFINGRVTSHYERTGHAVPISRTTTVVKFTRGLPRPMVAMRLAFFVTVAVMVVFGFAPLADSAAKTGIIACVFALFGFAVSKVILERYYVHTGRAQDTDTEAAR